MYRLSTGLTALALGLGSVILLESGLSKILSLGRPLAKTLKELRMPFGSKSAFLFGMFEVLASFGLLIFPRTIAIGFVCFIATSITVAGILAVSKGNHIDCNCGLISGRLGIVQLSIVPLWVVLIWAVFNRQVSGYSDLESLIFVLILASFFGVYSLLRRLAVLRSMLEIYGGLDSA